MKMSADGAGDAAPATRDQMLDGFRAVAALGVVLGHVIAFRYQEVFTGDLAIIGRLASPLAETGVHLFFAISGYIITKLLIREEGKAGRVNIKAFYARRTIRIWPPFFAYLTIVYLLSDQGFLEQDMVGILSAGAFICNTGLTECGWWVAHSWSLAVEEQYYLLWPVLFIVLGSRHRAWGLIAILALLALWFLAFPRQWHSNAISFSCIAMGALYASSPSMQDMVRKLASWWLWVIAVLGVLLIPQFATQIKVEIFTPPLILFILFATREIPVLCTILESRPFQWVGAASYSLYLWQQLFLASPDLYLLGALPIWGLPIATALSLFLIERPAIRLARRASAVLNRKPDRPVSEIA